MSDGNDDRPRGSVKRARFHDRKDDNDAMAETALEEEPLVVSVESDATSGPDDLSQEPEPINTSASTSQLFPGLTCQTVATLASRQGERYINMFGPKECPWFIIDSSPGDSEPDHELQMVSDRTERQIDRPVPYRERSSKIKLGDIVGVQYLACDVDISKQGDPLGLAEMLDPVEVKKSHTYKDAKARRAAAKADPEEIKKYPVTYLVVEFKKEVRPPEEGREAGVGPFAPTRSWETSSAFRSLHASAQQLRVEQAIYQVAVTRAQRFLKWYALRHAEDYARWKEDKDASRDVSPFTSSPTRSASPEKVRRSKSAEPQKARNSSNSKGESTAQRSQGEPDPARSSNTGSESKVADGSGGSDEEQLWKEIEDQWKTKYYKGKGEPTGAEKKRMDGYVRRQLELEA